MAEPARPAGYRSLLFVAADDGAGLAAALGSPADAVVADLEDAVPEPGKERARAAVAEAFAGAGGSTGRLVRINAADSGFVAADLALVASLDLDAVVVPRATPEGVASLGAVGPPLVAVVETAVGLRGAYEIALQPRVAALALGAKDLGLDLGLEPRSDAQELLFARSKLVVDAAAAGVRTLFDRVYPHGGDLAGLETDARLGRSLGYRGKSVLDPASAEVVNRVFGELP